MSVVFHENPGTSLGDVQYNNDTSEYIFKTVLAKESARNDNTVRQKDDV